LQDLENEKSTIPSSKKPEKRRPKGVGNRREGVAQDKKQEFKTIIWLLSSFTERLKDSIKQKFSPTNPRNKEKEHASPKRKEHDSKDRVQ
jgi:hypothetical protein